MRYIECMSRGVCFWWTRSEQGIAISTEGECPQGPRRRVELFLCFGFWVAQEKWQTKSLRTQHSKSDPASIYWRHWLILSRRLHQDLDKPSLSNKDHDLSGGPLPGTHSLVGEKTALSHDGTSLPSENAAVVDGLDGERDHEDFGAERPTEEEKRTLRHIGEPLPKAAFLVAIVELCERFTYYGASGIFQNYVQRPRDGSLGRGALGMGHKGATGLNVGSYLNFQWKHG